MTEACEKELIALGKEITDRKDAIVSEWLKTHKMPSRGVIEPEKQKALTLEMMRRTKEILEKYKPDH